MGVPVVVAGQGVLSSIGKPPIPVQVPRMVTDADQGGAPPALNHSEAGVVNNWGAGVYVGTWAGVAFADGDIAEMDENLGGFVRVLLNSGGFVPANYRFLVIGAGALGSFLGMENRFALSNGAGAYTFSIPQDGNQAIIIGEEEIYENQTFIYDAIVARWLSQGVITIPNSAQVNVDKAGDDDYGTGSLEAPFESINAALLAANAGDTIVIGPGIYAEQLVLNMQVNLVARIPGTVWIQLGVAAGAVVTVNGAAIGCVIDGIHIDNLSAAGAAAIALLVDNAAGTITGPITFDNGSLVAGAGASRALQFVGHAGGIVPLRLNVRNAYMTGSIDLALVLALDIVFFETVECAGGVAAWFNIAGAAGRVILDQLLLAAAASGETLNFGGGAATGIVLSMGDSVLAGVLDLDNLAGAGYVVMTAGNQIAQIIASQRNQIIQRWLGADEFAIECRSIDANGAPGDIAMYQVPLLRTFNPHTVRTINRGVATGALLNYGYSGSGANSVVGAVGVGALAPGIANEVVNQDQVPAAGTLAFSLAAASGAPGDLVDAEVIGKIF